MFRNIVFRPRIFSLKNYNLELFKSDLFAGITVGIVAIPLALAFAIASGVEPAVGFYTAIVAGFCISFFSGSKLQIGGPTGAFVIIIYGVIAKHGYDGLLLATFMAGVILIILGYARIGSFIKFIPYPVTTGFTAGIGVVILSSQIKDLFGLQIAEVPAEFFDKVYEFSRHIGTVDFQTITVGGLTIFLIIFIRKIFPKIPAHVFAITAMTGAVWLLGINVDTIASRFGEVPSTLPTFHIPDFSFAKLQAVFPSALSIALLAGIESLLSAVVVDGMTGDHHDSNTELIGQGMANIAVSFFGGIPATGAIARTATNVKAGGKTPIAGIIHAIFLLVFITFCSNLIGIIPMAALAGVLTIVSIDMMDLRKFTHLMHAPKSDVIVLIITFALTVIIDLTVAVQVGFVLAAILFMKRMSDVTSVDRINIDSSQHIDLACMDKDAISNKIVPKDVEVYEINGPFFFGVADILIHVLENISKAPKVFILRMRRVPAIDATGEHALEIFYSACKKHNTKLVLSGVDIVPYKTLKKLGFVDMVGAENILDHIDKALIRAEEIIENDVENK